MKSVPFFSNTDDNLHCYQSAVRMVLRNFYPEKAFTTKELDEMTGYQKSFWTWPMKGALAMQSMGLRVVYVYNFDYQQFFESGIVYFQEKYGKEMADAISKNSNIAIGQRDAGDLSQVIQPSVRVPTIHDIKNLLSQGYLLICWVNAFALNKKEGVEGHFVVVYECSDSDITFHDPGLPPQEGRRVSIKEFEHAWGYPNDDAKLIIGVTL